MLRQSGLYEGVREQRAVTEWPSVVGSALAAVTQPLHLRQGCLTVRVGGSAWRTELHYLLPSVLVQLNARLDQKVREIRLVTGRVAPLPAPGTGVRPRVQVAPEDRLEDLIARARAAAPRRRD